MIETEVSERRTPTGGEGTSFNLSVMGQSATDGELWPICILIGGGKGDE